MTTRMVPIEKIQELLLQIWFYTTNDADIAQQLTQILVNGEVNTNELRNLEELLIEKQMREVLQLLRETMRGNFDRLQEHRDMLDRFYKEHNPTTSGGKTCQWPSWCYQFAQENNPVVQEVNEHAGNENNQPSENSDQSVARSQHYENGSFRSPPFPPEEPDLPHPNSPIGNLPAGIMQHPDCCTCGKNIQHIGTSRQLEITDVLKELTPKQWQGFVAKLNDYPFILAHMKTHFFASTVTADAFIVTLVLQSHLSGRKCILCLLRKALEHIGRGDLAGQITDIVNRK